MVEASPPVSATSDRRYYAANREALRAKRRVHYARTREEHRARDLMRRYGITLAEWDALLERQGGHCAFCPATVGFRGGRLLVDHDHETGAVRGLLCYRCNTALGWFERHRVELGVYL